MIRRAVVIVVAAVAAVTAVWWGPAVLRPLGFFAVRRIEVDGSRYLAPERVVTAMGLGPTASVWANLAELERRVAALPGVESVTVTRRLPGTLIVDVIEEDPVALAIAPRGLVAVDRAGNPLPYDPAREPVDAPIVPRPDSGVLGVLAVVQDADAGLYADVAAARTAHGGDAGGGVVLELEAGRVRLAVPADPAVVRAVAAVRRDLEARGEAWRELDGRYRGWVVVRRAAPASGGGASGPAARGAARRGRRRGRARAA